MATVTKRYECDVCLERHGTAKAAIECCPPEPVPIYICSCGQEHYDDSKALACCGAERVEAMATPEELEAAGQQRLEL